ncbi:MAG TPA: RNA polymerase sigma factor [Planctomycetota bacterium]|nr:RNA polymerase sigma factor [Planctomycetota bacterium]
MAQPPIELQECLARVARGDQEAARDLVGRTHSMVQRLVRAHRSRRFSDEDLVQEVYLTMFAKLDRYSPRDGIPFEHWLSRLTVNTCRDALRGEQRRPCLPLMLDQAQASLEALDGASGSTHSDADAARELVELLLAQLAPDDSLVLTLLDLEQRPVAEIARITGWSPALVKVRAFRARRKLRAIAERRERGMP